MQYCQSNRSAKQQYIKKQSDFEWKTKKQGLITQSFYITARAGIDSS